MKFTIEIDARVSPILLGTACRRVHTWDLGFSIDLCIGDPR